MAWKPNSRQLAVVVPDGKSIKIWDTDSGREISSFTGFTESILYTSIIYSPDGRYLIVGTYGTLSVIDAGTGRAIKTIPAPHRMYSFKPQAYRPDGRQMAAVYTTGSYTIEGAIVIINTATWEATRSIPAKNNISAIAYSPDSQQMAIGYWSENESGKGCPINILDSNTGRELASIARHRLTINAVSFIRDSNQINAVSGDMVKIWNRESGVLLNTTRGNSVAPIDKSPDGKYLIEEYYSGGYYIRIKDPSTNNTYVILNGRYASFSPDSKWIVIGSEDGTIRLYSAETFAEKARFIAYDDGEWLAMTPDGYYAASVNGDKYLNARVGNTVTGIDPYRSVFNKPAVVAARLSNNGRMNHNDNIVSVAVNPAGTRIAAASLDKLVKIWDLESGRELRTISNIGGYANTVSWSPDGKYLINGAEDKTVRIWDAETGRVVRTITGHTDYVNEARYSPDGRRIASCADDKLIKIWDAETGREIRTLSGHTDMIPVVAWSPDGRRIASGSDVVEKTIRIWDAETGRVLQTIPGQGGRIRTLVFSPDGRWLASSTPEDKAIKIWDTTTGRQIRSISILYEGEAYNGGVFSLSWSPDGKRLVSGAVYGGEGSGDHVEIWDAETGECLRTISEGGTVFCITHTPDGRRIVAASNYSDAKFIKVYDALTGKEL
jgi:WD40 repeat protein